MARILLGVSGGIAAYKALELARLATSAGHGVRVADDADRRALRRAARRSRASSARRCSSTSSTATRCAAPSRATRPPAHDPIGHLELAANADAFLVAPASANTIAKLAAGICDSLLDDVVPRLHGAARRRAGDERPHVRATPPPRPTWRRCASAGSRVIEPDDGRARLARRARRRPPAGAGAAARRGRVAAARRARGPGTACGSLVTAGGTREPIDPVRFIGNRSSGRMGLALADRGRRAAAPTSP